MFLILGIMFAFITLTLILNEKPSGASPPFTGCLVYGVLGLLSLVFIILGFV